MIFSPYYEGTFLPIGGYYKVQKLLEKMLGTGLISVDEFSKITAKNRQTFSTFLSEIMPKMT